MWIFVFPFGRDCTISISAAINSIISILPFRNIPCSHSILHQCGIVVPPTFCDSSVSTISCGVKVRIRVSFQRVNHCVQQKSILLWLNKWFHFGAFATVWHTKLLDWLLQLLIEGCLSSLLTRELLFWRIQNWRASFQNVPYFCPWERCCHFNGIELELKKKLLFVSWVHYGLSSNLSASPSYVAHVGCISTRLTPNDTNVQEHAEDLLPVIYSQNPTVD